MNEILDLFDVYFDNVSSTELENDKKFVESQGFNGISFDEYLNILNTSTSIDSNPLGICDDIAYSDLYNKLIGKIEMGTAELRTINETLIETSLNNEFENDESLAFAA